MRVRRSVSWVSPLVIFGFLAAEGCAPPEPDQYATEEAVNPSQSQAITMSACNTALGTFDGTTAFSNGNDTGTGYSCAGSGAYGLQYQCVELVMRHFKTHWGLHWSGNAKDLLTNAPKSTVDVYMNGDGAHPPVPGDMIVWTEGGYGHVALVTDVHAGGIDILEQNVKGNGHATLGWDGATIAARWGNWVPEGWAHAKANSNGGTGGTGGGGGASSSSGTTSSTSSTSTAASTTSSTGSGNPPPVQWNCSNSAYAGQQYWTCSGGNLYECQGGVPVEHACSNGCNSNAVGTNDTCKSSAPPPSWNCANSAYAGKQYWTCSNGNIYECQNGVPVEQACSNGCQSNPLGTNDACL